MAEKAKSVVDLRDFPGMMTNADRFDLPPGGAEIQVNVGSWKAGELATRQGIKVVSFDEET